MSELADKQILEQAQTKLEQAKADLLLARLEVEKWEKFLNEYNRSHD